jgi:purine-nucleoside phosphorylase
MGKEFLIVFNVYGSQLLLEVLHLLKDGDSKKVFFIGSVGGKNLPVGTIILPTELIDKTGMVSVDDPGKVTVLPQVKSLQRIRSILRMIHQDWTEGTVASVPCVLHTIGRVKDFVDHKDAVVGIDMELSNFTHFSQKIGFENGALVYVSDNEKHNIISSSRTVQEARRKSLKIATQVATEFM